MRKFILVLGFVLVVLTINAQSISQDLVCTAGDSFTNDTYQLDWSIGELVTETYTVSQITLTQGFHQGDLLVTNIDENTSSEFLNIKAFPNPTKDLINLSGYENHSDLQFTISDLSGKVLQNGKILSENEQLNFSNYSVGMYFITIQQNNKIVKTIKIVKN
jgi:hypothetical protein